MKKMLTLLALFVAIGAGYWAWTTNQPTPSQQNVQNIAPTRPAEITGTVVSMEGNELVLAKEVGRVILSEEEQAAKQAERQKMSQEERQAARAEETAQYQTENVTLTIPVGVPIAQGTGDGTGNTQLTDLASLVKGTYLSIWTTIGNEVEYIKIKGM